MAHIYISWKSIYMPEVEIFAVFLVKSQSAILIFVKELSDNIFAFYNCYDEKKYKNYTYFFCPYAISLNLQLQFVIWRDFALAGSQHSHRKLNYQLFFSWNCKVQFLLLTQNCLTTFLRLEIGMMTNNSHKKSKNCFWYLNSRNISNVK